MSKMSVNVEFLCGTDVKEAIQEAKLKASLWNVAYVCFKFNGKSFSVSRNADVARMLTEFDDEYKYIVG